MNGAHSYLLLVMMSLPLVQQLWPIVTIRPLVGETVHKEYTDLTVENWWSGQFQNAFDQWHRENFGFHNALIRIRNQKEFSLYGKIHAAEVVMGKEGYIFSEPYLDAWSGQEVLGEEHFRDYAAKLLEVQSILKERGKTLIVAMAPGKASYFPEYVPRHYATVRQSPNDGETMARIYQEVGINLINYNREYIDRKQSSAYPLFGKTGIHWSNYGAALSLQEFIVRVEGDSHLDLPDLQILDISLSKSLKAPDGDLGQLLNLMVPPPDIPMALVEWEWESPEGHDTPRLTAFSDSFFQQFLHYDITPGCFREVHYFYYNSLMWHSTEKRQGDPWDKATKESALKSVDESDVILMMATEPSYSDIAFGYLNDLHEHLTKKPDEPAMP